MGERRRPAKNRPSIAGDVGCGRGRRRRGVSRPHVGYAAMLEQFGPQEVTDYTVAAEAAGFTGVMAADHCAAMGPSAGPGAVRLERPHGDGRTHQRRPRPRRHVSVVPLPPERRRAGVGDAGRHVPGPALARARLGRGAQRARHRAVLARGPRASAAHVGSHRDHPEALHAARTSSTEASSSSWRRCACGRWPTPPPIYRGHGRSDHGEACRTHRGRHHHAGSPGREGRRAARPVRPGCGARPAASRASR